MEESLQQRCRTCLLSGVSLISVLDQSSTCTVAEMLSECPNMDQLSTCTVAEMLAKCTNVTITDSDSLPKKVCMSCIIEIKRLYFFKMKCESSQDILQKYVEVEFELTTPKTEQPESSKKIISNMEGLTIIQALEMEALNQLNIEYKDLAEILADEEIRVPEEPVQNDNIPMEIIKSKVLDEQRQEIESDHDLEAIIQESSDNADDRNELKLQQIIIMYCENCCNTFESLEELDHSVDYDKVEMVNGKIVNKIMRKCPHCPNCFVNLEKHIEHHPKSVPAPAVVYPVDITCKRCDAKFTNDKSFRFHKARKCAHPQFVCKICGKIFIDDKYLIQHIKTHEKAFSQESDKRDDCPKSDDKDGEDSFMGEVIQQDFLSKYDSKWLPRETFTCSRCGARFAKKYSLDSHMKTNKCRTPSFTCKICTKVFIGDKYLTEHLKAHDNAFMCLRCESSFSSEKELKEHTKNKHNGVLKNECRLCGKVFTMLSTLEAHFRIHNGETPFLCSICGKRFLQDTSLERHVMSHKNYKSYEWNQCGSFVSTEELASHVRKHTGDHPFVCNMCNSAFKQASNLIRHKRIHTGERPYACDLCPIRFLQHGTLKDHRRSHTGEKPHQCPFCPHKFNRKFDRIIHMRCHTGERPNSCRVCGDRFESLKKLKTHMKLHEIDEEKQSKMAVIKFGITQDSETDKNDQEIIETEDGEIDL